LKGLAGVIGTSHPIRLASTVFATESSILKSAWARAYYERQLERGKKHYTAIRALAYKWIRILYRCWKDGLPYVESWHNNAQKKRSREAEAESAIVELQCKKVAGFLKVVTVNY
jgi:hypothetical protein